eukprot:gnl/Carplike_NY0171/809_a1111_1598.p1 GENE.gnl/Carplike_NY0171/809_a1111_1598~~gnl/Carplike_NY0171/809_a1111_1598.p1  ORF type:complete len:793 (+),score=281.47 gnl/Carplike_NY0171/809_a1111_1598:89-2380(+)
MVAPAQYSDSIQKLAELDQLRSDLLTVAQMKTSASDDDEFIKKTLVYCAKVKLLKTRIPPELGDKIALRWIESTQSAVVVTRDLDFEISAMLFNAAALLSARAKEENLTSQDGRKHFISNMIRSADALRRCQEHVEKCRVIFDGVDLNPDVLFIFRAIFCGQAAETFRMVNRADAVSKGKSRFTSLSCRVAAHALDLFTQANLRFEKLSSNLMNPFMQKLAPLVAAKTFYFSGLKDYDRACELSPFTMPGAAPLEDEYVQRFQSALSSFEEANKVIAANRAAIPYSLSNKVSTLLSKAKIYTQKALSGLKISPLDRVPLSAIQITVINYKDSLIKKIGHDIEFKPNSEEDPFRGVRSIVEQRTQAACREYMKEFLGPVVNVTAISTIVAHHMVKIGLPKKLLKFFSAEEVPQLPIPQSVQSSPAVATSPKAAAPSKAENSKIVDELISGVEKGTSQPTGTFDGDAWKFLESKGGSHGLEVLKSERDAACARCQAVLRHITDMVLAVQTQDREIATTTGQSFSTQILKQQVMNNITALNIHTQQLTQTTTIDKQVDTSYTHILPFIKKAETAKVHSVGATSVSGPTDTKAKEAAMPVLEGYKALVAALKQRCDFAQHAQTLITQEVPEEILKLKYSSAKYDSKEAHKLFGATLKVDKILSDTASAEQTVKDSLPALTSIMSKLGDAEKLLPPSEAEIAAKRQSENEVHMKALAEYRNLYLSFDNGKSYYTREEKELKFLDGIVASCVKTYYFQAKASLPPHLKL